MENIQEKFSNVYRRNEKHHGEIFLDRKYKDDLEWLILGYMTRMLKLRKELYPTYASKVKPPEPDFLTYDNSRIPFFPIEVTEVLHPNRRRTDEYRAYLKADEKKLNDEEIEKEVEAFEFELQKNYLDKSDWVPQIVKALRDKFLKRYGPKTWLLIYFNIPYSHISMYGWWHLTMEYIVKELLYSDNIEYADLKNPPYSRILMTDCEGDAMIQLYPGIYTIKEAVSKPLGTERNLDKW